jgi:DNA-binding transcriptional ArsR family regulator
MGQGKRPHHKALLLNARSTRRARALDATLAALADPQRRRVIDLLREKPRRAGELADALDLAAPTLSRHLRALKQSGLVEESHPDFDARVRIYALKAGAMSELKIWVDETERMWADQLSAFKAHIEKRK